MRVRACERSQTGVVSNPAGLVELRDLFADAYPNVHRALKKEIIGNYSLLYTWEGSDPALKPILLYVDSRGDCVEYWICSHLTVIQLFAAHLFLLIVCIENRV
jgi:hypothetical protein